MSSSHAARLVTTAICAALTTPALAVRAQAPEQAPPAAAQAAAASPAQQLGLLVYPAKEQSAEQQATDERECSEWAQQQTGLTVDAPAPSADSAGKATRAKTDSATAGAAVVGATRGAVAGVAIGAIAGDAGKGAAIGATAGAIAGRRARKAASAQAEAAGQHQAAASQDAKLGELKKAMAACLEGRGYTAK
jgi:hypothetical protein